ncbi:cytochrome P450 [Spirillospora sp. NPDC029432]|uniref:cytochrome P450 n=1 Tax=Spirillospora sp. NPDC029432 TaxID=3154599 RepID=UPI003453DE9F
MPSTTASGQRPHRHPSRGAETVPFRRIARQLVQDPLQAFTRIVDEHDGAITRVNLGLVRPYLVTRPEHVNHVLRDNAGNYPRQEMPCKPMSRLFGYGIGGEGPQHAEARRVLQPTFSGRHVTRTYADWAPVITEAVTELVQRGSDGRQVLDSYAEMTRILHRAVNRIFFGDAITAADAETVGELVGEALRTATTALLPRLAAPWMPQWIPLPGDRAFHRAVAAADDMIMPIVRRVRRERDVDLGVASMLAELGRDDRQIRDELVSLVVAGTETIAEALSWLWVVLDRQPELAEALHAEIDEVVGAGTPTLEQIRRLAFTRMLLDELVRVYTVWILPRRALGNDVIDGVPIKAGERVIVSPYLAHRVPSVWPDPERFDPGRFSEQAVAERRALHPKTFPFLSFGAGHHSCLGQNLFYLEASLILSTLLQRCRPVLRQCEGEPPIRPRVTLSLVPSRPIEITLQPRHG